MFLPFNKITGGTEGVLLFTFLNTCKLITNGFGVFHEGLGCFLGGQEVTEMDCSNG